jgi:hypothetical protein
MFGTEGLGAPVQIDRAEDGHTVKTYKRGPITIILRHNKPSPKAVQQTGKVLNDVVLSYLDRQATPGAA